MVGEKIRSGPRSPEFRVRKMDLTTGYHVPSSVSGSVSCVKPLRKRQGPCRCAQCIVPSCVHRQLESPKKGRDGCSTGVLTPSPHSHGFRALEQLFYISRNNFFSTQSRRQNGVVAMRFQLQNVIFLGRRISAPSSAPLSLASTVCESEAHLVLSLGFLSSCMS